MHNSNKIILLVSGKLMLLIHLTYFIKRYDVEYWSLKTQKKCTQLYQISNQCEKLYNELK